MPDPTRMPGSHDPICAPILAALDAKDRAAEPDGWRPTHRHKKRGSEYELIGIAKAQVSSPRGYRTLYENDKVAVYRARDGKLFCRFEDEFNDGRFERLAAPEPSPPASTGQEG